MIQARWQDFHCVSEEHGFKLVGWEEKLYSMRQILKKLRKQFPNEEFRSCYSQAYGVKFIQSRYKMERN